MAKRLDELEGFDDLIKSMKKLGEVPKKCVTPAARKGSKIILKRVKAKAPEDTGDLKKSLQLKGERTTKKGKKVFQIRIDPKMNDIFRKTAAKAKKLIFNRKTNEYEVRDKTSYYPASQEFGYYLRNGEYMPGTHYMRDGTTEVAPEAEHTIITELTKNIDKEWDKRNGN